MYPSRQHSSTTHLLVSTFNVSPASQLSSSPSRTQPVLIFVFHDLSPETRQVPPSTPLQSSFTSSPTFFVCYLRFKAGRLILLFFCSCSQTSVAQQLRSLDLSNPVYLSSLSCIVFSRPSPSNDLFARLRCQLASLAKLVPLSRHRLRNSFCRSSSQQWRVC